MYKKYRALQSVLQALLKDLAMDVVLDRTHRTRDSILKDLIRRAHNDMAHLDSITEEQVQDMEDIPF